MAALMETKNFNQDCNWYPNSSATNHLTNSLGNLSVSSKYLENNQVHIENDTDLPITRISYASITSSSNHVFHPHNLIHVPTITKNLISVSQVAKYNSVFFEFHPNFCFVKDPSNWMGSSPRDSS